MPPDIVAAKFLLGSFKKDKTTFKDMESEIRGEIASGNCKN